MNHSIFITGGTGFLGSSLIQALHKKNFTIHCLCRKQSNFVRLIGLDNIRWIEADNINYEQYFVDNKIDIVIHCATNYGRDGESEEDIINTNIKLPCDILQAAINNVKLFINTDTVLTGNINKYSETKKKFLKIFQKYKSKLACANICLDIFYGPNDDQKKFINEIIYKLKRNEKEINLTLGEQKRNLIYIDDVVSAYVTIINSSFSLAYGFYQFEVAPNETTQLKHLLLKLKKMTNNSQTNLNFGKLSYRKNEVMNCKMNNKSLLELGWVPFYSLEEGLKKTIDGIGV